MKKQLLELDATSIAQKIVNGSVTSEEVVRTFIEHILHREQDINAIVEDRFEEALAEAKEVDEQLQKGRHKQGPLYGVPISVKESFDVEGMKTTGGLHHRKNFTAHQDASVVAKLKEAGAIILCKTNTPSLCFCQETDNKLYGRTNNPWDEARTAGGSSGGEGALLAIGGAAAGIGSDIGGSIRFPSHFNGVIGFKPGQFQVSEQGHFPSFDIPIQARMAGSGPMGKSVQDTELMYNIVAKEPASKQTGKNMAIQFLPDTQPYPISQTTKDKITTVQKFLKESFTTEQAMPPYFTDSAVMWQEIMSIDGGKAMKEILFEKSKGNVITSYLKEVMTRRTQIHTYLSWALIGSSLFKPSKRRVEELHSMINKGDEQLADYFYNRLLIMPVYHTGAQKHGNVYQEIFSIRKTFKKFMPYASYANVWGLPSLTIPVGTDENNMPIGIQIISAIGNEGALFSIGKMIEEYFRGYVRNTHFDKNNHT